MANKRGNATAAEAGDETFLLDATDYVQTSAQTARSDAWQAADAARVKANDLAKQAADAAAEANDLEAKATSDDDEVKHDPPDSSAGTWEAAVGGDTSTAPAVKEAPES